MGFIEELRRARGKEVRTEQKRLELISRESNDKKRAQDKEREGIAALKRQSEQYLAQTSFKTMADELHDIDPRIHIGYLHGEENHAPTTETNARMYIIFDSQNIKGTLYYKEKYTIVEVNPEGEVFVYGKGRFGSVNYIKLSIDDWQNNPAVQEKALGFAYNNPLTHRGYTKTSRFSRPVSGTDD